MKIYKVKSESNPEVFYEVRHFPKDKRFVCNCPAHAFGKIGFECKHIIKTKKYLAQKGKTTAPESPIEPPLPKKQPEIEKELVIKTKKQYKKTKTEVKKLSKEIGENRSSKKFNRYQKLSDDMLNYEIEHDLLPL